MIGFVSLFMDFFVRKELIGVKQEEPPPQQEGGRQTCRKGWIPRTSWTCVLMAAEDCSLSDLPRGAFHSRSVKKRVFGEETSSSGPWGFSGLRGYGEESKAFLETGLPM